MINYLLSTDIYIKLGKSIDEAEQITKKNRFLVGMNEDLALRLLLLAKNSGMTNASLARLEQEIFSCLNERRYRNERTFVKTDNKLDLENELIRYYKVELDNMNLEDKKRR